MQGVFFLACGMWNPSSPARPGIKPMPPDMGHDILTIGLPGKSQELRVS